MNTRLFLAALTACTSAFAATNGPSPVTFNKDVAPILQKNCQACHRPGEPAPMPLLTYKQVRPWASAIKEAVALKRMPPWFADPHVGKWANDRSLTKNDIDTVVRWVDSGAPEGNPKDAPVPVKFLEGWNIEKPDMVLEMPADYHVPAKGTIAYQYILIKGNFTEDKWVTMAEVRPGNRAVVHHVIAFVRPPGSKWMQDAIPGVPYEPKKGDGGGPSEFLVGFAPGVMPQRMEPGRARLIKAGSDIIFQMHYTANGKEGDDRTRIGLKFTSETPKERVYTLAAVNNKFAIPAGDSNYQVDSSFTLGHDVKIVSFLPHMHLRGKDFDYRVKYPDGRTEEILNVPHYSFSWQLSYNPVKDLELPAGAAIECTAHYDNSANNPDNPDPTQVVRHGDQSWEEMMNGFFDVAFDPRLEPKELMPPKKNAAAPRPAL
ncbi:MAG TPA: thiol-disulfide isomerase [Bryobacteraceae bacterium]|jgi:hypothetical protein